MNQTLSIPDKVKLYKNRVSSRYFSVEFEGILERIQKNKEYYASTKYDGHFYALHYKEGESPYFINPKGKRVEETNLVKAVENLFFDKKNLKQCLIPGEIYLKSDVRTRAFNLTKALTDESDNLRFAAFDIIEINDEPSYQKTTAQIIEELENYFPLEGKIHAVDNKVFTSRQEIAECFKETVEINEQEGLVVKTEQHIYKIKPKYTFDAVVIGYADSDGNRQGMFRDLLLAMMLSDGTFQLVGHLHHGFSDEGRKKLLQELEKERVPSQYIEVARNKTAFQFVKPTRIVEFSCLDVITEDSKGSVGKMNLNYSDKEGYTINGNKNSVSFTIANFIKFRDDKKVNEQDIRFSQLEEVASFEDVDILDVSDLPESEIIYREVYTKTVKENVNVRKFVVIETNKAQSKKYPAYILHYTDFSATRKDPLKRELRLTDNKEQVLELLAASIEKNIKKGWEKQ